MAHRDRPFSDTEKVNLLAEIIKTSSIPPSVLLQVIYEHSIVPQWADVVRPPGRSTTECEQAFGELRSSYPNLSQPPSVPRPSPSSYSAPLAQPPFHHRPWNPAEPPLSQQQQQQQQQQPPNPIRSLQPRPQGVPSNVYSPSGTPYATTPTEPQFKKRGRPTNAEVELRKQEAEARGEIYAPQRSRKRSKATQPSTATPQSAKRLSMGIGARPGEEPSSAEESKRSSLVGTSSRSPPPQISPGALGSPPQARELPPPSSLEPRQPDPTLSASVGFAATDRFRGPGPPPPPPPRHYSPGQPHPPPPPHQHGLTLPHPGSNPQSRAMGMGAPPTTTRASPAPPPPR